MAQCPSCKRKLKPWHVKAECPFCGENIPNHNWEERLENDAKRSEAAFELLRLRKHNFKYSLFSDKLFILRFICTFLPLTVLIMPICTANLNLPFISGEKSFGILNIVLWIINNGFDVSKAFALAKAPVTGSSFVILYASVILLLMSVVIAVINFFLLLLRSFSLGGKANIVCNAISLLCIVLSGILLPRFFSGIYALSITFAGDFSFGICIFIGAAIYILNLTFAVICEKKLSKKRKDYINSRFELKKECR